jgi:hypothetical protein
MSCCWERSTRLPVFRKYAPSTAPVEEKDQHEPHSPGPPWTSTGRETIYWTATST